MQCLCPAISKWITWVQPSRSSLASCRGQAVAVRRIRRTSRVDGWCEGSSAVTISCISHWSALFFDTGHYSRCPYSADIIRYLCIIFRYSTFFSTPLGPARVGTSLHQSSCFSLVVQTPFAKPLRGDTVGISNNQSSTYWDKGARGVGERPFFPPHQL